MSGDSFDDPIALDRQSLRLIDLLSNGLDSLLSKTGALLVGAMAIIGIVSSILQQSLAVEILTDMLEYVRENADTSDPEIQQTLDEAQRNVDAMASGFDVPILVALLGLLVLALVSEAVLIVGVRAFANTEHDGIPVTLVKRRLPAATLYGFLGGILLMIAIGIGLVLLVVPGLLILVGTVFFRQEIAVADKGPLQAISGTWELTKGHRWSLLGLIVALWLISLAVTLLVAPLIAPSGTAGIAVESLFGGLTTVFSVAVVTDAYVQLRGSPGDETTGSPGSDDLTL
ncbi:MAG: hypothetical protein V5A27_04005 [Halapricum sp.]